VLEHDRGQRRGGDGEKLAARVLVECVLGHDIPFN
jgi:hypothetical protein